MSPSQDEYNDQRCWTASYVGTAGFSSSAGKANLSDVSWTSPALIGDALRMQLGRAPRC